MAQWHRDDRKPGLGRRPHGLRRDDQHPQERQFQLARDNVAWAADQAAAAGCQVMIEAVNSMENGPYLLTSTAAAARFISGVGRDNVRLQYDAYHMQRMEGDLTATLDRYWELISHIQVADVPGRGEPGTGKAIRAVAMSTPSSTASEVRRPSPRPTRR